MVEKLLAKDELVCTITLAWDVILPAHVVAIKLFSIDYEENESHVFRILRVRTPFSRN